MLAAAAMCYRLVLLERLLHSSQASLPTAATSSAMVMDSSRITVCNVSSAAAGGRTPKSMSRRNGAQVRRKIRILLQISQGFAGRGLRIPIIIGQILETALKTVFSCVHLVNERLHGQELFSVTFFQARQFGL